MSCAHTRAVLCGDAPAVPVDAHLDSCADCRALADELAGIDVLFSELPPLQPPPDLVARTERAMDQLLVEAAEPRSSRRRWRWVGGTISVAAAAALLSVVLPTESPTDTSRMVERGVGERLPEVALKVAVERNGQLARLAEDGAYGAGDLLYFRASVDAPAELMLVRLDARGAEVVHRQPATPGEADLALAGGPLAWQLEAGEHDAVFALLASPAPLEQSAVVDALSSAYDPDDAQAACAAALPLGARCAAAAVHVSSEPR